MKSFQPTSPVGKPESDPEVLPPEADPAPTRLRQSVRRVQREEIRESRVDVEVVIETP